MITEEKKEIDIVVSERGDIQIRTIIWKRGETLRESLIRHGYTTFLCDDGDLDNVKGPQHNSVRIRIP